ncbi:MAG: hypothetical protein PHW10_05120 [Candidatus Peribacteraceae bacterium]|nr:hypothetical protein [Candidatus Peribacteraceae bacterium]
MINVRSSVTSFRELRLLSFDERIPEVPENVPTKDQLQQLRTQVQNSTRKFTEQKEGKEETLLILSLKQKEELKKEIQAVRSRLETDGKLDETTKGYLQTLEQFVEVCPTEEPAEKSGWEKAKEMFDSVVGKLKNFGSGTLKMLAGWFGADSWFGERLREYSASAEAQIVELYKQFPSLKDLQEGGGQQMEELRLLLSKNAEKIKETMGKTGATAKDVMNFDFVEHVKAIVKQGKKYASVTEIKKISQEMLASFTKQAEEKKEDDKKEAKPDEKKDGKEEEKKA